MIRVLRRILGRARAQARAWSERQAAAAALRGLSDRELADIALTRADIPAVARGTYDDPREAIFAAREQARLKAEAEARAAVAVTRIAA